MKYNDSYNIFAKPVDKPSFGVLTIEPADMIFVSRRRLAAFVFAVSALYSALAFLPPYFYGIDNNVASTIRHLGSAICHQRPSRCLWINDFPCGLCAKCSGFYLGLLLASLLYLLKNVFVGVISLAISSPVLYLLLDSTILPKRAPSPEINALNFWLALIAGVGVFQSLVLLLGIKGGPMSFIRRRLSAILALVAAINLFGFGMTFAQDVEPTVPQPRPKITIPAGTGVILQIEGGITTKESREGDAVPMHVVSPVRISETIVIRSGTPARGVISMARSASSWGGAGELVIEAKSVAAIDGTDVLLTGSSSRRGETSHGASAAVAVGTGILCLPLALTGAAVKGEEGRVLPGFELVARTINDQTIVIPSEAEQVEIQKQQEVIAAKQRAEAEAKAQLWREEEARKKKKGSAKDSD